MKSAQIIVTLFALFAWTAVMAQQNGADKPDPCSVVPAFHCVQTLADGTLLAYFGYSYSCPDGSRPKLEKYIDIGKSNLFKPGAKDRGQSKMFLPGRHVNVFQVELSPKEVRKKVPLTWNVLGRTAQVSYTTTADGDLDCSKLPK